MARTVGVGIIVLVTCATVAAKPETIRGILVDKACYERDSRNTGQKHVDRPLDECAKTCAKYGLPLAVLTKDGKLYQITGELAAKRNARSAEHVTFAVEVTGEVTKDEDGGLKIEGTTIRRIN